MEILLNISSELLICGKPQQINPIYFNIYSPQDIVIPEREDIVTTPTLHIQTYPLYKKKEKVRLSRSCSWSF